MDDERLKKAIDLAQRAVALDREKKYEEALEVYRTSLDHWFLVIKYQKNEELKKKLMQKMDEYMQRAEQIKKFLSGQVVQTTKPMATADGDQENGDGKDEEDDKLKGQLASAIVTEKPNVHWSDVAGLDNAKSALKEAVILPVKFPQLFTGQRKPWKGILLYGPPGTGKSYLAKACATEAESNFMSVSASDLVSKWQGESEKLVKTMFEMARANKPSIIFIDEVDSLCGARSDNESESSRRIKTEFLVQMQGVGHTSEGILVLGATNIPWGLDSAIRRRFERRVYIPLPDLPARKRLFELHIGKTANSLSDEDLTELAKQTDGYSGADISILVNDALFQPVRKCQTAKFFKKIQKDGKTMWMPCSPSDKPNKEMTLMEVEGSSLAVPDVTVDDFYNALGNVKPSVNEEDLKKQQDWTDQFGMEG
uniref:Uncharacterized protein n=1 Tax=Chromera velia CCMP2878 TaxID=1169474 RepID=A0A0G4FIS9_9ALVE|eukprot:Cvel_17244.t1-p1 / transcript=Cvel_17244.t1 / gene=Cvel_17244 / organism=Chromera_velia_CCMP2878 / gene_product=Vacuolar protein sorting-associated protein 4B, putative / transcript_product=Vacuolar protein sorting-associated protein 4B, putative / location=Cvel_scaffold1365:28188-33711(-) / protein_length=423 / sequence_SO=supercontig / SO=protein_coding / is_pseudo=false